MKRLGALAVCLALSGSSSAVDISTAPLTASPSDDAYLGAPSSPTAYQLRQMRRQSPRRRTLRQLEAMPRKIRRKIEREIKKTAPNPNVRSPTASPMPANSPEMPTLPVPPPKPTGTERFFAGAAKVMTRSWNGNIFVWLPAISTDPNAGPTYGVLPVLVLADP